ncbi:peptidyl-prolyl cis-trans isomerase, cyclophilin-type [Rhodotorula toruloides]|uniref:Peptidyl-prolyl cis-trans isomerase n=1 Tax=Rhodotorula toruloides TaxID=5286 RepID=A0A511KFW1_RHOTO|nr:peptidyl-prolyl cis-trans isomerase, cyclophilin-type [Rhodotorula toruloides]
MQGTRCWIDFAAGDSQAYEGALGRYHELVKWLAEHGAKYGLLGTLDELDDTGREMLTAVYEGDTKISLQPCDLSPPPSLLLPRLSFTVSSAPGLKKTVANFLALLTDEKKLASKRPPNAPLRYKGSRVFRIEEGFVAQTGDVTRQDGCGGESIYGGSFNDEKDGLKVPFELGTIAMANSGKNSNTSQFFVTLTFDSAKLKKLTGRYVAFGQADVEDVDTKRCFERLNQLADGKGGTTVPVWVEDCNVVQE